MGRSRIGRGNLCWLRFARTDLGYNADLHIRQFRFIANRRARQVGVTEPFPGAENVLPWLDEQANLRKEKNFFETRVTEYQTGGALAWE